MLNNQDLLFNNLISKIHLICVIRHMEVNYRNSNAIIQMKHLIHYLKHRGGLVEWEALGNARFGYVVFADLFDVHNHRNKSLSYINMEIE